MKAIGLMSGTSLDGIDTALCEIDGCGNNTKIKLLDFYVHPIPEELKRKIKDACLSDNFTTRDVCSLNFEFGKLLSDAVKQIKEHNNLSDDDINFIASHGQTIYHLPNPDSNEAASTLQIGETAIIAYDHRTTVVSNFRVMDMAAKGQGAPLVPHSEIILYAKPNKVIALQNIGGIGNVSIIKNNDASAFDTGPGNMMIDEAMWQLFKQKYDENGKVAASGKLNQELFDQLCQHPYLKMVPPKSTGREMFGEQFVTDLLQKFAHVKKEDIIHTFTKFTAYCMYDSYNAYTNDIIDEIIIGGGGAYNQTLLHMIQEYFPDSKVLTQEDLGYTSDAKEAIAFVILGNETLNFRPSNVLNATGAENLVILGNITLNPFKYLQQ